ncbi:MAG TPA: endonuclease V, partial [Candidatus Nitrosotenuis sp.]|nr:endonuclease V [Candidatus Nitrosotenuis sp.]
MQGWLALARALQEQGRRRVRLEPLPPVRTVAGVDACYRGDQAWGAAVVMARGSLEVVARATACVSRVCPYVPGFLALREGPAVLEALGRLPTRPDCLLVDGHGLLHPRRFGLACFLGVALDLPSVGCAKTPWKAEWTMPGPARGEWTPVRLDGEVVGAA